MTDERTGGLSLARQLKADLWPRLDARIAGFFADNQGEVTYVDLAEGNSLHYVLEGGVLTLVFAGERVQIQGVGEGSAAATAHKWARLRPPSK